MILSKSSAMSIPILLNTYKSRKLNVKKKSNALFFYESNRSAKNQTSSGY